MCLTWWHVPNKFRTFGSFYLCCWLVCNPLLSHILLNTNRIGSTNTFDSTGISFEIVFPDVFKSFCTGNHDKANVDLVHMPMECVMCVINIYKGL